jgi:hypothetical protein
MHAVSLLVPGFSHSTAMQRVSHGYGQGEDAFQSLNNPHTITSPAHCGAALYRAAGADAAPHAVGIRVLRPGLFQ